MKYELQPRTSSRITFLGDSFTAGAGIKNVEDRFGNILRTRLPGTEIHVLARGGFASTDHLRTAEYISDLDYQTDAVVLAYMMNDIMPWVPFSGALYHRILQCSHSLSYLERESYFLNTLTFRLKALRDPDFKNYLLWMQEAYQGPFWEENAAVLRELRQRLATKDIPLLVVTLPFMQDLKGYGFEAVHEQLADFWEAEDVQHLDLLPLFREHADLSLVVHHWDAHPNEFAHELIADAIQAFLIKEGIVIPVKQP